MRAHQHLIALAFLAGLGVATAARAAPLSAPATRLELSADASAEVQETLLVATLTVVAEGRHPAFVQGDVNTAMTKALAAARERSAIKARTSSYAIWPLDEKTSPRLRYHAEQSLSLTAEDGAALLDLVGRLQAEGLEVRSLDHAPAPAAIADARRRLLDDALHDLRATAEQAATAMGMRLNGWEEVRIEPGGGLSSPLPFRAMVTERAAAGQPPVAAAGTQHITVTVSGKALLAPGP